MIPALVLLILSALMTPLLSGLSLPKATPELQLTESSPYLWYDPTEIQRSWVEWRDRQITTEDAGPAPRQRVITTPPNITISEGQAYGILFASIFDEQDLLDGLWLFAADHLNEGGLMDWEIRGYQEVIGRGSATDADLDMAMGMINACYKVRDGEWTTSSYGVDYCQVATNLINAMWDYNVDHPGPGPDAGLDNNEGYELIPGDLWVMRNDFPQGVTNPSYFSPGYMRIFAEFTDNPGWYNVIERNYEIGRLAQTKPGNCSSLVPDWTTYQGDVAPVGSKSAYWSWNAARFSWRLAVDWHWYQAPEANEILNDIGSFFSTIGVEDIRSEYRMNGTYIQTYNSPFFTAHGAAAIWAATDMLPMECGQAAGPLKSNPQDAYNTLVEIRAGDYYNDAWRLLTLMLMTGHFPHPYQ